MPFYNPIFTPTNNLLLVGDGSITATSVPHVPKAPHLVHTGSGSMEAGDIVAIVLVSVIFGVPLTAGLMFITYILLRLLYDKCCRSLRLRSRQEHNPRFDDEHSSVYEEEWRSHVVSNPFLCPPTGLEFNETALPSLAGIEAGLPTPSVYIPNPVMHSGGYFIGHTQYDTDGHHGYLPPPPGSINLSC